MKSRKLALLWGLADQGATFPTEGKYHDPSSALNFVKI
jgi:hypothetical protein